MKLAIMHRYLIFSLSVFIVLGISTDKTPTNAGAESGPANLPSDYISSMMTPMSIQSIPQTASSNSTLRTQAYSLNNASVVPNAFVIERNWTGSIPTFTAVMEAFKSQIKISMNEATTTALDEVGKNSTAISSTLQPESGFLVYIVRVVDNNNQIRHVVVDAGNGNVLADILLPNIDVAKMSSGPVPGQPAGPLGPITGRGYAMPALPPPIPNSGGGYAMPALPPPIPNSGGGYAMPALPPPIPNSGGGYAMPPLSIPASPPAGTAQPMQPPSPIQ
jgi:uncharacterized membrane protein YkoI